MSTAIDTFFSPFRQTVDHFWNMPITNWNRFFNPQFVLNYNDVGVENHVLSRVGSYGSQLSTLINMIAILRDQLPADLNAEQKSTVKAFERLCEKSREAVAEYRGGDIVKSDEILAQLMKLKSEDEAQFEIVRRSLAQMGD